MSAEQHTTRRRLIPASKWNQYYPYPSGPGLRSLIFDAEKNGFSRCIRRVGRRILIDEQEFFQWVDAQNAAASK